VKTNRYLSPHLLIASIFVIVLTLMGSAGLWVQFETSQEQLRSRMIEQADRRSIQLSDAVSDQFALLLSTIDYALLGLRDTWLTEPGEFEAASQSIAQRFPGKALSHIAVIGSDGSYIDANQEPIDRIQAAARKYFQTYAEGREESLHIGHPTYVPDKEQWFVPITRPVQRDGRLVGVVLVALSANYLASQLAKANVSKQDIVVLLDQEGKFLARNTGMEKAMGRTVQQDRPFLNDEAPVNGVFHAPATLDAITRIFGWTKLNQYGLIVVVGLDQDYFLEPFKQQYSSERRRSFLMLLVVLTLGASTSLLLLRISRQQEKLRASRESLNEAQRIAKIGNWELDIKRNRLFWSEEIYRILGMDPKKFRATYEAFLDTIHPDDRDYVNTRYQGAIKGQFPYEVEHRIVRRDNGEIRWVHERAVHRRDGQGNVVRSCGTVQDITERKQLEDELRKLATTDYLTGLATRRSFIERLEDELARGHRAMWQPVAVLLIDLDHFKEVNDSHGHATGDAVLIHFSRLVGDELRRIDMAGRLGGEEFGIILPGTNAEAARNYAERLRKRIHDTPFIHKGQHISFSISIGVAEAISEDKDPEAILERADNALYLAKKSGRNKVEVYTEA